LALEEVEEVEEAVTEQKSERELCLSAGRRVDVDVGKRFEGPTYILCVGLPFVEVYDP